MSSLTKKLFVLVLMSTLPACIIVEDFKEHLKATESKQEISLPYRHASSELVVAWNTEQIGNETVLVAGSIKNLQKAKMLDIYVDVKISENGSGLSEGGVSLPDVTLYTNESNVFNVRLNNAKIQEGYVLKFNIFYRLDTGAWGGSGGKSSFQVDAMTGRAIEKKAEI